MSLSLNNIRYGGKSLRNAGTLRVTENGMGWKSKQGKSISFLKEKISRMEWILIAKGKGQLRVYTTEGKCHIYDGIPQSDINSLEDTARMYFDQVVDHISLNTSGWNWGQPKFEGSFMNFHVNKQKAFDIPLSIVEQAHYDKNDVVIGFPQDNSTSIEGAETLLEMRLWVPNVEDDLSKPSTAESVLNAVLDKAEVLSAKGTGIATFNQVTVKTPRGRYDLDIFGNFMRMKGTQSSTITYDCITRLTQLVSPDEKDRILVVSLDPPLRRGHTSYPHILMQFPMQEALSIDLELTEDQKEKYEGKLEEEMSGNKFDVISQIFRVITGIKLTKKGNYSSVNEFDAVRCSLKAHDGYFPITLIPFDAISHVEFARLSASKQTSRTFDLVVFMKDSGDKSTYIFNSISKDEHQPIEDFLRSRGITIRGMTRKEQVAQVVGDEEESEDDDFTGADELSDELEYDDADAVPIDKDEVTILSDDDEDSEVDLTKKRSKRPTGGNSPSRKKAKFD